MAASTFTLSSTTLSQPAQVGDSQIVVTSTSGIVPGVALFINREQMIVERLTGIGNAVLVRRGQNGTETRAHGTVDTLWVGSPDYFFTSDPQGTPQIAPRVLPHINILTGVVWYVQGDEDGPSAQARTWQPATTSQTIGPLGVRVTTTTIPS